MGSGVTQLKTCLVTSRPIIEEISAPGVKPITAGQGEPLSTFRTEGGHRLVAWGMLWDAREVLGDCTGLTVGCAGDEITGE